LTRFDSDFMNPQNDDVRAVCSSLFIARTIADNPESGDESYRFFYSVFGPRDLKIQKSLVMNSSVDFSEDGVGSLWCAVRKDRFKRTWDKWELEVSE